MPDGVESQEPSPERIGASRAATLLLTHLIDRGLRHVVIAPGSRSQALALAAAELERDGELTVHVRIDERAAGFLALGIALESGVPAAVVTTSGTAVANLHPAMLEAWHSGVPLIAITADRPDEMRGTGANQTTTQPGIFGPAAAYSTDLGAGAGEVRIWATASTAYAEALRSGPVHLNVAFREPLSGVAGGVRRGGLGDLEFAAPAAPTLLSRGPRTVIIAGTGAGPEAEEFAHSSGWPLLAEVASGARFGRSVIPGYRAVLADRELGGRVERAIVFGRPNLSREVPALLMRDDVEAIVVASRGAEQFRPGGRGVVVEAVAVDPAEPVTPEERSWFGDWLQAGRALAEDADDLPYRGGSGSDEAAVRGALAREELAAVRSPNTRRSLVEAVWRASWPHDRLFLAASRLVREADLVVPGKRIPVRANRGLAGIDGSISSAIGIAIASQERGTGAAGTTRALLGDLAFLHDVGGLLQAPGEWTPRVQLIVGNDRGGTIFDGLEVAGTADRADFERVMLTPHAVDIAAIAAAYGWHHTLATDRGTLDKALIAPVPGLSIVEVPLDR